jgi:hypothetical protein
MRRRLEDTGISAEYNIFFEVMGKLQKSLINNKEIEIIKELFFDLAYFVNVYFDKIEKDSPDQNDIEFIVLYRKRLARFLRALNSGKREEAVSNIFFLKGMFYDYLLTKNKKVEKENIVYA